MMTRTGIAVACLLTLVSAATESPGFQDELLDHFVGEWVLQGTIAGGEVTHDIVAEWVLDHQYLRFHDLARERDAEGKPAYEAYVHIGWNEPAQRYACLWLDSTGGSGLNGEGMGHAVRDGDTLPFKFGMGEGAVFHTTFKYLRESDSWEWTMDSERDGQMRPFARVTLTRR